jgi:hypothetical protein
VFSPRSTHSLAAERVGQEQKMGLPPDENLPEVVPDTSPQVLTRAEAYRQNVRDEADAKFAVAYESDTTSPKYYYDPNEKWDGGHAAGAGAGWSPSVGAYVPPESRAGGGGGGDPRLLHEGKDVESGRTERRICGLRRKLFLILVVVIVGLVAAIGGGVGGAMASKGKKGDAASTATFSGANEPVLIKPPAAG